jgi:hypothetical protein
VKAGGVGLHNNSSNKMGILKCIFSHPVLSREQKFVVFFRSFSWLLQLDVELSNTENWKMAFNICHPTALNFPVKRISCSIISIG